MKVIFESHNLTIASSLSRKNTPKIDGVFFRNLKEAALGTKFDLSLIFIGNDAMRKLNRDYRKKDYPTDILSFEVDHNVGEIFINPYKARSKAKLFERTAENYLKFVFLHGMMHLKGHDHETDSEADKMEKAEIRIRKKFNI